MFHRLQCGKITGNKKFHSVIKYFSMDIFWGQSTRSNTLYINNVTLAIGPLSLELRPPMAPIAQC